MAVYLGLRAGKELGRTFSNQNENNLKEFSDYLNGLSEEINSEVIEQLTETWNKVYNEAVSRTPIQTGALVSTLAESITSNPKAKGEEPIFEGVISAGGDKAPYAEWVENGHFTTSGEWIDGVFFLSMSLEEYEAELMEAMDRAMKRVGAT